MTFEDNAGGIRVNPLDMIFEPFFTFEKKNGSGIGLFMSKLIVEKNMQGKLKAYNKNDGAFFEMKIPKE